MAQTLMQDAGSQIYVNDMGLGGGGPNNSTFRVGDEHLSKVDTAMAGPTFPT